MSSRSVGVYMSCSLLVFPRLEASGADRRTVNAFLMYEWESRVGSVLGVGGVGWKRVRESIEPEGTACGRLGVTP